jgi:carbamoyltransferase
MSISILGISAFYHDSAATLVVDGKIIAAAQEERFSRKKHDHAFPFHAIDFCLARAGLRPEQLDYVGFYDKPLMKFERLLETYLSYAPCGFRSFLNAMPLWLKQKLYVPREISRGLNHAFDKRYVFSEHHESHAASAFFPSPFEAAAILTLDGVGEWATGSYGTGLGNRIELTHEQRFPHSLGLLYSAFTYYCGFVVNSGEYKLMGLAPYGEPKHVDLILENLLDLKEDGSFRMDMSYFNYGQGLTMTSEKFHRLFGGPPRNPDAPLEERDMDIAASIQKVTEKIMIRSVNHLHRETAMENLCLAGGVALNCVGNGRILREGPFKNVWIQPAAGDAGGSLGVALLIWHQLLDKPRKNDRTDHQGGSLLGTEYDDEQIASFLTGVAASYERIDDDERMCEVVAEAIDEGQVVGWHQGRMEFGPRALGSRSILGDARDPEMQAIINMKVKFREGFRPFAPIVLSEHAHEYFGLEETQESPYMLIVAPVRESHRLEIPGEIADAKRMDKLKQQRSTVPAVTHVDYSARVPPVDLARHRLLRKLLEKFYQRTGCPVMVNTSFNLGWDPIVCSPEDAYRTFMASNIDMLSMGHFVLRKRAQRASVKLTENNTSEDHLKGRLVSPCCGVAINRSDETYVCEKCRHEFPVTDNIPQFFWPHEAVEDTTDVTDIVKSFYENNPFPDYDDHDSVRVLIEKSRRGRYARRLDESIPYNSSILEVGCGTGQLTNFLGSSCRQVIGTDMCHNSLRLGENFRRENGLDRIRFLQMNLFRPSLRAGQFDVVLCNGVLHHTTDPYGGFRSLVPLVKPGGYIVLGLYNTYGRLLTDFRRQIFRITAGRARWIDPVLRKRSFGSNKRQAWFADQYRHPHESKHTFGEVLRWFDEQGVRFVRGVPAMRCDDDSLGGPSLFKRQPQGSALDHFLVQVSLIFSAGQQEGGFFVMIGQVLGDEDRVSEPGKYPTWR